MKNAFHRFFDVFKLSNLKRQAHDLGKEITFKSLMLVILGVILAVYIVCSMLKLNIYYMILCVIFLLLCTPHIILLVFRGGYEKYRFKDVVEYMEQLIYAFHKSGKINDALLDVYSTSEGYIKETVGEMLTCINGEKMITDPYQSAFAIMEGKYQCTRLHLLHDFLVECEERGGDSSDALEMLINDIRGWSERTLEYQAQRKKARNDVILSIMLALLTCGMMINLIPTEYTNNIIVQPIYQLVTMFCVIANIIVFIVVQTKVSKSYLDIELDGDSSNYAVRKREWLENYNKKDHFKPMIIKVCVLFSFVIVEAVLKFNYYIIIPTAIVALIVLVFDGLRKNSAVSIVTKELYMMFPQWIRTLSLALQTDNVHVAVQNSLATCPRIIQHDVEHFIEDLSEDPVSAKPFNKFLSDYNVPTLRLSINYLYLASQFGTEDSLAQLDYLVAQNTQLTIQEEKMRNDAALAGINLFIFAPMLVAIIKLLLDLALFLSQFMTLMSNYI